MDEQTRRLVDREKDPLKQWKTSPIDAVALKKWDAYSAARGAMLLQTHTPLRRGASCGRATSVSRA
jgi:polyphosphate kinase 2 (PPK2 family)